LPAIAATKNKTQMRMTPIQTNKPKPIDTNMNILAFFDDSIAPATSPAAILLLTCVAKTIETTPAGKQHNTVDRIAGIK
jgi:hypothetical protein